MPDYLIIKGVRATCGPSRAGHREPNPLTLGVDVELKTDFGREARSQHIGDTIDHARVCAEIHTVVRNASFDALDRIAGSIADRLLEMGPDAVKVRVAIRDVMRVPHAEAVVFVVERNQAGG